MLEWIGSIDAAWLALIGTVFGGAGLKLLEGFLGRNKDKTDAATAMRNELRTESTTLREELRMVERDLDSWKEKYFLLLQEYLELKSTFAYEGGNAKGLPHGKNKPDSQQALRTEERLPGQKATDRSDHTEW